MSLPPKTKIELIELRRIGPVWASRTEERNAPHPARSGW